VSTNDPEVIESLRASCNGIGRRESSLGFRGGRNVFGGGKDAFGGGRGGLRGGILHCIGMSMAEVVIPAMGELFGVRAT